MDGSKIEANASKHKAMSHGRMGLEIQRLEREIRELEDEANQITVAAAVTNQALAKIQRDRIRKEEPLW